MSEKLSAEALSVLNASADEAERGYDTQLLDRKMKMGRPRTVGTKAPAKIVQIRLDSEVDAEIDKIAAANGETRSAFIRRAIAHELATAA